MMKLIKSVTIVLVLFNMASAVAQSFDLKDIDAKLNQIHDDDQQIRAKWRDAFQQNLPTMQSIVSEMHAVDSVNQKYVSMLLDDHGWPDNLSEKANEAIFLVIDHASNSFSEKYFHLVREKGEQGILPMSSVATLEDRILMRTSKPQKYGTQSIGLLFTYTMPSGDTKVENNFYIWPNEDNEKVDELRTAVGLPPMDQYLQELEDSVKGKVIWDKNLTIDDLKAKYPMLFSK